MIILQVFIVLLISSAIWCNRVKRVTDGKYSSIKEHPYQVAILNKKSYHCSGSIINENHILTAGHCAYGYSSTDLQIRVGSTKCCTGGFLTAVEDIYLHEKYNSSSYDYDIAILKIDTNLTDYFISIDPIESIQLTNLPLLNQLPLSGIVAGWGSTREDRKHVNILRQIKVKVLPKGRCKELVDGVTSRMFCAGFIGGGKDTCQGDSGAPLVIKDDIQIGIVSWGVGCGEKHSPGIYTNVYYFKNWIKNKINKI